MTRAAILGVVVCLCAGLASAGTRADLSGDDVVNATDLALLAENMGFSAPTGQAIPEPATLGLLGLGGLALLNRRREK